MPDFRVTLSVVVTVRDGTDPEVLAEKLMDFLASDPDDLFPEITVVEGFDYATD